MMMAGAASCLPLMPTAAYAQDHAATANFNIPAQDLGEAVAEFGRQSRLQVTAGSGLLAGRKSAAVSGRLAPVEALSRLLNGTGLTWRWIDRNTVALEAAPQSADGSIQLGPVRVEGSGGGSPSYSAATEGTQSYAAPLVTLGKSVQQRREIPQSISVITRQQMEDQNLTNVIDTLRQATGVFTVDQGEGTGIFYSRGYAMEAQYDGVPTGRSSLNGLPQFDMALYDRLEVLRGPAGLLNGSGTPGGSVNLVRKRPLDSFHISGSTYAGSWNNFHGDIDVTGPLNAAGTIRGRLIAVGEDRDYFYDGAHNKKFMGSALLDIDVTPTTTVSLAAVIQRNTLTGGSPALPVYSDGSLPDVARSTSVGADWNSYKYPVEEYSAEIRQKISNSWNLTGVVRYRHSSLDAQYYVPSGYADAASSTVDFYGRSTAWPYENLEADIRAQGSVSLFGREHELLLGYNYSFVEMDGGYASSYLSGQNIFSPTLSKSDLPDAVASFVEQEKQSGFYGSGRFKLTDDITLILGGRVTRFRSRGADAAKTSWTIYGDKKGEFTPYAGLVWDVTSNFTLYASYTDIFQPQITRGYNNVALPPRVGWQAETGVKGEFLDSQLSTTIALFRIEDENRPVTDTDPTHICDTWNSVCTTAAGRVRSQGVEAEISGKLTPQWNIIASYTYNDIKYRADTDSTLIGQKVSPDLPAHMAKLWTMYQFDKAVLNGRLDGLTVGAGLLVQGKTYADAGTFRVQQNGYATMDLQIGYRFDQHLSASLSVNNLFDKSYFERVTTSTVRYGTPRNALLTIRAKY